jgi:gliding motility-associated-like protein
MMAKTSGRNMFIAKYLLLALPLMLSCAVMSQDGVVSSIESSNCLSCDGTSTVVLLTLDEATYTWFDQYGGQVISETNMIGISTVSGLCPGVYSVEIVQGSETELLYSSVESGASDAGTFQTILECSQNAPVDLDLVLNPVVAGNWVDPNGVADDGIFDPQLDIAGFYSFEVSEGACTYSTGVLVELSEQADPGNTTTYLICETYEPFEMLDLLAGTPETGGTWFAPGPVAIESVFYPSTMGTGLFTYMIDSVVGCPPIWTTMYVVENFLPDAGLGEDILVCPSALPFDMTSALGGNPEITGIWYDEVNNVVSNVFDPNTSPDGVYTYVVSGLTPCPLQEAELIVDFTADIDPGTNGAVSECDIFGPIDLFASLGGTPTDGGDWFDPSGLEVGPLLDLFSAESGVYTYELSGMGCATATVTVDVSIEQVPNAGGNQEITICELEGQVDLTNVLGVNATLGGGFLNSDSQWIDPNVDLLVGQTQFFFYFLEGNVCPDDQAQINLITDEAPIAGPDDIILLCEDEGVVDISLWATDFDGDIVWLENGSGPINPVFDSGLATGTAFTYITLSSNSCPDDEAEIEVQVESLPFPSSVSEIDLCSSVTSYDLDQFLTGINSNDGDWFDNQGTAIGSSIITPQNGEYSFVSNTINVCPDAQIDVVLDVTIQPEAGVGNDLEVCYDASGIDLFDLLDGESSDDGSWSYGGTIVSSVVEPSEQLGGFYSYEIEAIGPCPGSSASVQILIDSGFDFEAGIDVFACSGSEEIQLGQTSLGSVEYLWEPGVNLDDITISDPTLTVANNTQEPIEVEYTVWVSNGICEVLDTVDVIVYPLPVIEMLDIVVCENDWIELDTQADGQHTWQPEWLFNDPTDADQQIQVSADQDIFVEVVNAWGCVSSDTFEILVLASPQASFTVDPVEGCAPLIVTVENLGNNLGDVEYFWELSNGFTSNEEAPVFVFTEAGQHDIVLTAFGENGCMSLQNALQFVTVHPAPQASFSLDESVISELDPVVGVDNWSIGADDYEWYVDGQIYSTEFEPQIELTFAPNHEYWICLESTTEFGCNDSTCHSLFVEGEFWIYAPNTFTPDNDGVNEVFKPIVSGIDESTYLLSIFNRWGELVFETTDPNQAWIGDHQRGKHYVPNGTYVWRLTARHKYNADVISEGGHVTIIR